MTTLKQRIERILKLRAKATKGRWYHSACDVMCEIRGIDSPLTIARAMQITPDAAFIASIHDMADLLAELLPMVDDARRYKQLRDGDWTELQRETLMFLSDNAFDTVVDAAIDAQMNKENSDD